MSKPREEVKEKEYYKDIYFLYEIIGSFKTIEELKGFLKDILTRSELRMLKRRWHIANLIFEGYDLRTVALKAQTSTQTVSKVKRVLDEGQGGLLLAIERKSHRIEKERGNYKRSRRMRGGSKYVKGWFQ